MTEPITITRACGCEAISTPDENGDFDQQVNWCPKHENAARVLRFILDDFDLLLAETIAKRKTKSDQGVQRSK